MSCLYPLTGYYSKYRNPDTGKRSIVFSPREALSTDQHRVELPCGKCHKCKLKKSVDWAVRITHETQMAKYPSYFVTLTYDNDHLPYDECINKEHVSKFIKNLRRKVEYRERDIPKENRTKIKTYGSCEYGPTGTKRPHYHVMLINVPYLDDLEEWRKIRGNKYYISPTLAECWENQGYHSITEANWQNAAYVARYVLKKRTTYKGADIKKKQWTKHAVDRHYEWTTRHGEIIVRPPEDSCIVSKGIGRNWLETYKDDVYPSDEVIHKARRYRPPQYYDYRHNIDSPEEMKKIKRKRKIKALDACARPQPSIKSKEIHAQQTVNLLKRGLENGT